ncbi:uncharacterized protein [Nicotiana tomentosiformis]|uniref:uncharacterized protein n=1 Tax=Nicotiana tomentosiformis TaxID=4098 RepID=UPI00388C7041
MGIVESNEVDFAVFQMTGSAKRWWRDCVLARPANSPALTWEQFSQLFLERFVPITLREEYRRHFECLQQGSMTVTQYETRFVDLARHAIVLLPTEKERVRRFIDELTYTIRLQMAKETGSDISFQTTVNIARQIELVHAQEIGSVSYKRPRYSGNFRGASSGGRGTYGRGHPPKPFYSALQASHGASGSHGPIMSYSRQQTFSAHSTPISAPSLQSHYSRYPACSGHLQLQQPQQQDECYDCGNIGHIRRYCPRLSSNRSQQDSRAIIPAPVAPSPSRPARGRGQTARGGGRVVRGECQPVRGHPRDVAPTGRAWPQFYAFPASLEAESSDIVITGIVQVCHRDASVLFDPGFTYSYMSSYFASHLVVLHDSLSASVHMSMQVGDSIVRVWLLLGVLKLA